MKFYVKKGKILLLWTLMIYIATRKTSMFILSLYSGMVYWNGAYI